MPDNEQELLASWLLAELAKENDFDGAIAGSSDKLARLAEEALAEHRAGLTQELDPMESTPNDPVIDEIREVRHRISEKFGHDPEKLVAYYMQMQEPYRDCPM